MSKAQKVMRSCVCLCGNPRALLMSDVNGNPYIKCGCGRTFLGDENMPRFVGYLLIEKMLRQNLAAHKAAIDAALDLKLEAIRQKALQPKVRKKAANKP